ncbi:hypothetical protein DAD186_18760 [Dermabacter vaginalis]|uniref:Uncharacterized protein n=1 Tax=Dermabacter vaginalis TaxID=1630135 RepID=A0A1B0ZKF3_9MICO|nr:hypothetical protein DAD186_18760 [Dermabacter vaginalis]
MWGRESGQKGGALSSASRGRSGIKRALGGVVSAFDESAPVQTWTTRTWVSNHSLAL